MNPSLIDTDIISYFLKGNEKVFLKFKEYLLQHNSINISVITYYEIMSGLTFINATKQIEIFENFCNTASILNLTKDSVINSAKIYSKQRSKGKAIDDIDIIIAGIALSNNLILVTNNIRHFEKVEGLKIENWNE